jgi:sortase A
MDVVMRRPAAIALVLSLALAACGSDPPPLPVAKAAKAAKVGPWFREGQRLGRLTFPRLHKSVRVTAGFKQATIDRGPSWYTGSWLPGEGRTIYIAGHRRTHGGPFRHLGKLRRGDRVIFTTRHAVATYAVKRHALIDERRTSILTSGNREELRLQTCTIPAGHKRLLVFARLASFKRR